MSYLEFEFDNEIYQKAASLKNRHSMMSISHLLYLSTSSAIDFQCSPEAVLQLVVERYQIQGDIFPVDSKSFLQNGNLGGEEILERRNKEVLDFAEYASPKKALAHFPMPCNRSFDVTSCHVMSSTCSLSTSFAFPGCSWRKSGLQKASS